jgi:hypothetical protein
MKRFIFLVCLSSSMLAAPSCTRISSTTTEYKASLAPQGKARGAIIAVADFSDERAPLALTEAQKKKLHKQGPFAAEALSSSLYGIDGNSTFGITHQEKKFTPVSRAIRDYTYQELLSSRHATIPIDGQELETSLRSAKEQGADYLLYGEVTKFSFVTDRPEMKPGRTALRATAVVLAAIGVAAVSDGSEVTPIEESYESTPVTVHYETELTLTLISLENNQIVWSKRFEDTQERVDPSSMSAPLFNEVLAPLLAQASDEATRAISIENTRGKPVQTMDVQE